MITPNHAAHYDSAALYLAADQLDTPLYFMTAWQVFGMASKWDQFLMQRMGCFSIDRESTDRKAYRQALHVLQNETCPLVVFPEGDIYHITDRVTPFREGAAAMAVSAARRSDRQVHVVPCGIKFWYLDDPMPKLDRLMTELDERMFLRPERSRPLQERIYRFAEAILSLKEIEYLGRSQPGRLANRIRNLAESILDGLETKHNPASRVTLQSGVDAKQPESLDAIPERVKDLRKHIIGRLDEIRGNQRRKRHGRQQHNVFASEQFMELTGDMDDLFFVMQLYSYPGDYLQENPSIERLAETLDKFEEDVLNRDVPSVRGNRCVEVNFGQPIEVPARSGRNTVKDLTKEMQGDVQQLVDQISSLGRPEPPPRKRFRLRRKAVA